MASPGQQPAEGLEMSNALYNRASVHLKRGKELLTTPDHGGLPQAFEEFKNAAQYLQLFVKYEKAPQTELLNQQKMKANGLLKKVVDVAMKIGGNLKAMAAAGPGAVISPPNVTNVHATPPSAGQQPAATNPPAAFGAPKPPQPQFGTGTPKPLATPASHLPATKAPAALFGTGPPKAQAPQSEGFGAGAPKVPGTAIFGANKAGPGPATPTAVPQPVAAAKPAAAAPFGSKAAAKSALAPVPFGSPKKAAVTAAAQPPLPHTITYAELLKKVHDDESLLEVLANADHLQRVCLGPSFYNVDSDQTGPIGGSTKGTTMHLKGPAGIFVEELAELLKLDVQKAERLFISFIRTANLETRTQDIESELWKRYKDKVARQKLMDNIMDYYHEERVLALRCQQELLSSVILKPELLPGQGEPERERRKMIRYIAEGTVNLFQNNPLAAEINRQLSLRTAAVAAAATAKAAPNAPTGDPFASLGIGAPSGLDLNAFGTSKKAAKSSPNKDQTAASQKQLLNEGQRMRWAAQVLKERKECMQVLLLFRQLKDMTGDPGYDPEQDASKFYREHEQNLMVAAIVHRYDPLAALFDSSEGRQMMQQLVTDVEFLQTILCFQVTVFTEMLSHAQDRDVIVQYFGMMSELDNKIGGWAGKSVPQEGEPEEGQDYWRGLASKPRIMADAAEPPHPPERAAPIMLLWAALLQRIYPDRKYFALGHAKELKVDGWQAFIAVAGERGPFDLLLRADMRAKHSFKVDGLPEGKAYGVIENTVVGQMRRFVDFVAPTFDIPAELTVLLTAIVHRRHSQAVSQESSDAPALESIHKWIWNAIDSSLSGQHSLAQELGLGRYFPFRIALLTDLMHGLAGVGAGIGVWDGDDGVAEGQMDFLAKVFHYLQNQTVFTRKDVDGLHEHGEEFVMPAGVSVYMLGARFPDHDLGPTIPPGTRGTAGLCFDERVMHWMLPDTYSAWGYMFWFLDQLLLSNPADLAQHMDDAVSIVRLIGCMYTDASIADELEQHVMTMVGHASPQMQQQLENCRRLVSSASVALANRPLLAQVLLLLKLSAGQTPSPVDLTAACVQCIAAAAQTAPSFLIRLLVAYEPFTAPPKGSYATAPPKGFAETMGGLWYERGEGRSAITLASLTLTNNLVHNLVYNESALVGSSRDSSGFNVQAVLTELRGLIEIAEQVLDDFNTFQNDDFLERCEIGQMMLSIFNKILAVDVSSGARSSGVIGLTLRDELQRGIHSSGLGTALLKIIAARTILDKGDAGSKHGGSNIVVSGSEYIGNLYQQRQETLAREWSKVVELALIAVLRALKNQTQVASGYTLTEFQNSLLGDGSQEFSSAAAARGYHNMVTDIASYLKHRETPELPINATQILTEICKFASHAGSRSVAGCLGPAPSGVGDGSLSKQKTLQAIFVTRIEQQMTPAELIVAMLDCIKEATLSQKGLARLFLDIRKTGVKSASKIESNVGSADATAAASGDATIAALAAKNAAEEQAIAKLKVPPRFGEMSCMHEVLKILHEQETKGRFKDIPHVPAAAAALVHTLWLANISDAFRYRKDFWKNFVTPLAYPKDIQDHKQWRYQTLAQASVLEVLALEAFMTRGDVKLGVKTGGDNPHTAMEAVWRKKISANGAQRDLKVADLCPTHYFPDEDFLESHGYQKAAALVEAQGKLISAWSKFIIVATKASGPAGPANRWKECYGIKDAKEELALFLAKSLRDFTASIQVTSSSNQMADDMTPQGGTIGPLGIASGVGAMNIGTPGAAVTDAAGSRPIVPPGPPSLLAECVAMAATLGETMVILLQRSKPGNQTFNADKKRDLFKFMAQTLASISKGGSAMDSLWVSLNTSLMHVVQTFDPDFDSQELAKMVDIVWENLGTRLELRLSSVQMPSEINELSVASSSLALLELLLPKLPVATVQSSAIFRDGALEIMFESLSRCMASATDHQLAHRIVHFTLMLIRLGPHIATMTLCNGRLAATDRGGLAYHLTQGGVDLLRGAKSTMQPGLANVSMLPPYTGAFERNPWHELWCNSILLLTAALRAVRRRQGFLDDALIFATVHVHQLTAALEAVNATIPQTAGLGVDLNPVQIGQLDEVVVTMDLLAELSQYAEFRQRMPDFFGKDGMVNKVRHVFHNCVRSWAPTHDAFHFRQSNGSKRIQAYTVSEKEDNKTDYVPTANGRAVPPNSKFEGKYSLLEVSAIGRMLKIVQPTLTFLRNISLPISPVTLGAAGPFYSGAAESSGGQASGHTSKRMAMSATMCADDLVATRRLFPQVFNPLGTEPNYATLTTFIQIICKLFRWLPTERPQQAQSLPAGMCEDEYVVTDDDQELLVEQTILLMVSQFAFEKADRGGADADFEKELGAKLDDVVKHAHGVKSAFCAKEDRAIGELEKAGGYRHPGPLQALHDKGGFFRLLKEFTESLSGEGSLCV